MAITNVAKIGNQGLGATNKVEFINLVDLDLDASYPNAGGGAGGYPSFSATIQTAIGTDRTIIGIIQEGPSGPAGFDYICRWNRVTDKLQVFQSNGAAAAFIEIANGVSLATVTNLRFLVFSK